MKATTEMVWAQSTVGVWEGNEHMVLPFLTTSLGLHPLCLLHSRPQLAAPRPSPVSVGLGLSSHIDSGPEAVPLDSSLGPARSAVCTALAQTRRPRPRSATAALAPPQRARPGLGACGGLRVGTHGGGQRLTRFLQLASSPYSQPTVSRGAPASEFG